MKLINLLLPLTALCVCLTTHAQVTTSNLRGQSVEQMLLEQFVGSGVDISNATFNGQSIIPETQGGQIATFENTGNCNMLGIQKGLVLSSDNNDNIITGNTSSIIESFNLTPQDIYDIANKYLPLLYQEELANNLDLYKYYKSYSLHYFKEYSLMTYGSEITEEEYNQLMEKIGTDPIFLDLSNYYSYSDLFLLHTGYSADKYSSYKNTNWEDYFEVYAVYKVVRSWDPKYYLVDEDLIKDTKELTNTPQFINSFNVYYINQKPEETYDKTKDGLYEQVRKQLFYDNKSNLIKDNDLRKMVGGQIFSPAILEFDFSTTDDTVAFNYSFASQEYPQYVGTNYNDAFAFFVTDLTTGKIENIAKIPGTEQSVTINNVNASRNKNYFISNYNYKERSYKCNLMMGGFTTTLTATKEVVPCRLYHMKIAIANVSDFQLPSSVFLEAGSFKSNGISAKTKFSKINARGIVDGCSNGEIVLKVKKNDSPIRVKISHIGEAKNGIHYKKMPEEIIIPANTDSVSLELTPLPIEQDSLEIVMLLETETSCANSLGDTIRTYIYNNTPITITPNAAKCCATELSVEHTGNVKKIKWTPSELLAESDDFVVHPLTCPNKEEVFTIIAENIFGCQIVEEKLTLKPCADGLGVTAEFVTENEKPILIEGCNDGKLVFNVSREDMNIEDAQLQFTYSTNSISGLKKTLNIPANKPTFELPIAAIKKASPYHEDNEVLVECLNCTTEPTSFTFAIKTEQQEPLVIKKDNEYNGCDLKGLKLEVPLLSGNLGDVKWEDENLLSDIDQLTATIAAAIESDVKIKVTASDTSGCQTTSANVTITKDCLGVTAELVTDNKTPNLIADCNKGKLVFYITGKKQVGKEVLINLNYGEGDHLANLPKNLAFTISATKEKYEFPIEAEKSADAYYTPVSLGIECTNCSLPSDTTLQFSTLQPEKLVLEDVEYKDCKVEGLALEVPLTSGTLGKVVWEPAKPLSDINELSATLASDVEDQQKFTVTAKDTTGCLTAKSTVTVIKEDCIEVSTELVTDNNTTELVSDCNEGKLLFHITRNKQKGKNVEIKINYDADANLSLAETISIPGKDNLYAVPIKALNGATPYHNEVSLEVVCANCTQPSDTTLQLSTTQLEPLLLEQSNVYESCKLNGLEVTVPLISGNVGEVVWEPSDKLANTDMLNATLVDEIKQGSDLTVTAIDETGCQKASANVKVVKKLCIDINAPIFFTPNGDDENDVWKVYGLEETEKSTVKIYDRWGKLLFEFDANSNGWDGTYNGNLCPSTDYWYVIDCEELDKVYTGHFTLIRK